MFCLHMYAHVSQEVRPAILSKKVARSLILDKFTDFKSQKGSIDPLNFLSCVTMHHIVVLTHYPHAYRANAIALHV